MRDDSILIICQTITALHDSIGSYDVNSPDVQRGIPAAFKPIARSFKEDFAPFAKELTPRQREICSQALTLLLQTLSQNMDAIPGLKPIYDSIKDLHLGENVAQPSHAEILHALIINESHIRSLENSDTESDSSFKSCNDNFSNSGSDASSSIEEVNNPDDLYIGNKSTQHETGQINPLKRRRSSI